MKRNELASAYLHQYEATEVIITDISEFDGGVVFDLSDGTYWFSDNNDTCQVGSSLTTVEIGWSDNDGWVILNEDGTESQIDWL